MIPVALSALAPRESRAKVCASEGKAFSCLEGKFSAEAEEELVFER